MCHLIFNVYDTDNSGTIEFNEFLISMAMSSRMNENEQMEFAFKLCDVNKDGLVERKELAKLLEVIKKLTLSFMK